MGLAFVGLAFLGVASLVVACGRAQDAPEPLSRASLENDREPVPMVSGAAAADAGASSSAEAACTGPSCPQCAAPALAISEGQPVWSRNPASGECCRYVDLAVAPPSWPYFDTEAACQSDCRCSALEGYSADFESYSTARSSLECRCSAESCPATLAEAEQRVCSRGPDFAAQRLEGCGLVFVTNNGGFGGEGWVFEGAPGPLDAGAPAARLVGAYESSDVPFGACRTYGWIAGVEFDCDSAVACQLCGDALGASVPPCQ